MSRGSRGVSASRVSSSERSFSHRSSSGAVASGLRLHSCCRFRQVTAPGGCGGKCSFTLLLLLRLLMQGSDSFRRSCWAASIIFLSAV
ncbi:hypothetical protein FKM82_009174 [Ascaphus truei]